MKNTINKQQVFVEFVSVVFAVILALILNGWRESSALEANAVKVKDAIRKEAVRNDSLIQQSHSYRQELLQTLYANENVLSAFAVADFPVDVNDNDALAEFFKTAIIFQQKEYYDNVQVLQHESMRVLILDKSVYDLKIEADTLWMMGIGNIQLKIPDLNNSSWQLAQATNTIVNMDIELVEKLSTLNALIESYIKAGENALQMLHSDDQQGVISSIEDMYSLESKIIEANDLVLDELGNSSDN